jgi:acetolactate decarboxylase
MRRLALALFAVAGHGGQGTDVEVVQHGAMRAVMREGRSEARVAVAEALKPGVVAIGALAGLAGEITVLDGKAWIARVEAGALRVGEPAADAQATLLTLARVEAWQMVAIGEACGGAELERRIAELALVNGIETKRPFPFRIEGRATSLEAHVVNGACAMQDDDHERAPLRWSLAEPAAVTLVGFHAEGRAGELTHHGTSVHLHAVVTAKDGSVRSGHVDRVALASGASLGLPQRRASSKTDTRQDAAPAKTETLNPFVLEVLARYPTDGTHRYWWPRGEEAKGWMGCTKDLVYDGKLLSRGDPEGRAYCCGLTFEVFLEAWRLACERAGRPFRIGDLDLEAVRRLQRQWFGSAEDKTCLRTALVDNRLGRRLDKWQDAEPGDFVQLWRENGSGHSVVFLSWLREQGAIVGLEYWSTQPATNGIGKAIERFDGPGRKRLLREQVYLCRAGR